MKDDINLLPPPILHQRVLRVYMRRITHVFWASMAAVGFIAIACITSVFVLKYIQTEIHKSDGNTQDSSQTIEQQIAEANTMAGEVRKFNQQKVAWTPLLEDVLRGAPAGITITEVELRTPPEASADPQKFLVISGTAASRKDVVDYERILRGAEWVKRLESPLQNLAGSKEVTFSFFLYRS